jgi:hypothetical protein
VRALRWASAFHLDAGELATEHWRIPHYATGRYPVRRIGSSQPRQPITLCDTPVPDGQAVIDVELKTFTEINPDLLLEPTSIDRSSPSIELVELDLIDRASTNGRSFDPARWVERETRHDVGYRVAPNGRTDPLSVCVCVGRSSHRPLSILLPTMAWLADPGRCWAANNQLGL